MVAVDEPLTHRRRNDMNLLSRRNVLAIAPVVDVALHSRSTPVGAKNLGCASQIASSPPGDVAPGLGSRQDPQGRARAAGRVRAGARAPAHQGGRNRAHREVAEHRRSRRSRVKPVLLERVIDPAVRRAAKPFSPTSMRSRSNRCVAPPRRRMYSTTKRSAAISPSDAGVGRR